MSAFGLSDEQLEELNKALSERIKSLSASPHVRLGYPPMMKGNDVDCPALTTAATRDHYKPKAN